MLKKKLASQHLVAYEKYGAILLTEKGTVFFKNFFAFYLNYSQVLTISLFCKIEEISGDLGPTAPVLRLGFEPKSTE